MNDILKYINTKCGYKFSEIVQTRKLLYKSSLLKEIWVLKMKSLPSNAGTDFAILGKCPAKISSIYTPK